MHQHERLDVETLTALADTTGDDLRVSLYAPMIKAGPETRQNPIRFKNLLREARDALEQGGLASGDVEALLAPATERVDDYEFWQHQETGLAMFLGADTAHAFHVPLELGELCVVTDRFHLKPLFPLLTGDGRFHVLALSQNAVRLLECSRHAVREVRLDDDVPRSLADALGHELTEQQLQFHTPNRDTGIFHAHGGGTDDVKPEIRKFLGMVDAGIASYLRQGGRDLPLVLAAVDALAAMYREASDHRLIVDGVVSGNPEQRSAEELHEAAWPHVEPHFDRARHESVERFGQARADGTGSTELGEIVIAAGEGRVDTLFVARGVRRWGRVDEQARRVEEDEAHAPGNEDLLDRAAVATWRNGGEVFAVDPEEVPDEAALAAIYRY